jgi:hypothetical protein
MVLGALVITLAWAHIALAEKKEIDLAKTNIAEEIITVPVGQLVVAIKNSLPSARYRVEWDIHRNPVEPLPPPPGGSQNVTGTDPCSALRTAMTKLWQCKDEAAVQALSDAFEQERKNAPRDKCKAALDEAGILHNRMLFDAAEVYLGADAELRVIVSRLGPDDKTERVWKRTYRTQPLGEWFLSYGFTFIPSEDELYFAKSVAPGKFQVTKKHDNQETDFAPAIFYAWMPEKFASSMFAPSLAAGLGFDLDNPVVFLGLSLSYHYNVSVLGGGVMHRVKRLNGIYSPGDTLSENLTEAQLTEETYDLGWFFGVSFRFGSAPKSHQGVVKALEIDNAAGTSKPEGDQNGEEKKDDAKSDDGKKYTPKKEGDKPKGQ